MQELPSKWLWMKVGSKISWAWLSLRLRLRFSYSTYRSRCWCLREQIWNRNTWQNNRRKRLQRQSRKRQLRSHFQKPFPQLFPMIKFPHLFMILNKNLLLKLILLLLIRHIDQLFLNWQLKFFKNDEVLILVFLSDLSGLF